MTQVPNASYFFQSALNPPEQGFSDESAQGYVPNCKFSEASNRLKPSPVKVPEVAGCFDDDATGYIIPVSSLAASLIID